MAMRCRSSRVGIGVPGGGIPKPDAGRLKTAPELVGAPWIDGARLARYLQARGIPGVRFAAANFAPTADRYAREPCHGVEISLIDRSALNTPLLGVELAAALHRLYQERFQVERTLGLFGSEATLEAIEEGTDPRLVSAGWRADLEAFKALRAKYLIYQ